MENEKGRDSAYRRKEIRRYEGDRSTRREGGSEKGRDREREEKDRRDRKEVERERTTESEKEKRRERKK